MKRLLPMIAAVLLVTPAAASAATTTVDSAATGGCARGGTCALINGAIGVSEPGDTVAIKAGQYGENVDVDVAQLTLAAAPGAVLISPTGNTALTVSAANAAIDGIGVLTSGDGVPAVASRGGGMRLTDALLVSLKGSGVALTTGSDNRIQRSTVLADTDGIHLNVTGGGERRLAVDSSVVSSQSGSAFRVTTSIGSGAAFMTLNHVTAALAPGKAVTLEGAGAGVLTPGNITFEANSSILHGASSATAFAGNPPIPVPAPNSVTATYKNSDATKMTVSGGATATGDGTVTDDSQLFAEGTRLKSTAPVIDRGGALAAGESTTDFEGDARVIGPASDIGADEYVNHAPTAKLTLSATDLKSDEVFDATATATDQDGRSDIASYTFDWGDGNVETVSASQLAHSYGAGGTYEIRLTVTDRAGATSDVATGSVTVTDGTPPQVIITSPKPLSKVKLAGKRRRSLAIKGVHADNVAVESVEVALTRRSGGCAQYDGTSFVSAKCKQFTFVPATLKGFRFRLDTPKMKWRRGSYQVRVRATDAAGNVSEGFSKDARSMVVFKAR